LKALIAAVQRFGRAIVQLPREVGLRLRVIQRERNQDKAEAERIDRIRHPEKYRGK